MKANINKYINIFKGKRALLIGDTMVDHYIWGDVNRISPEAPVPVVDVLSESVLLGGAGNVAHNICALGGTALLCGVVGEDQAGEWLKRELQSKGILIEGVISEKGRPTTQKTRIVARQQHVVRYDHEKAADVTPKTERYLLDYLMDQMKQADCMVISDYAKGVITKGLLSKALPIAYKKDMPVIVDPKIKHFSLYKKITIITPNHREASQGSGIDIVDDVTLGQAGRAILKQIQGRAVLITRGEQGMSLFEQDGSVTHIPTVAKEVFDVTGAGDTVVATLSLALAAGATFVESALLANAAAGVVVGMVGTAVIDQAGLREVLS